jgi:hypothetical protein
MKFFETGEGQLRISRTVGLMLLLALGLSWRDALKPDPLFITRVIFTAGWWMAFSWKRPARTEPRNRLVGLGVLLVFAGAVLQLGVVLYRW